jgi:hypothetical protein
MRNFIKHFVRESDGAWNCIERGEVLLSGGRIEVTEGARFTPGTIFMGVDLAKLLDAEFIRQHGHRP